MSSKGYVLGADSRELLRLEHQHAVWRPVSEAAFDRLGIQPGWKVLDAGCGPGFTLLDLRARVGPEGSVWGVDVSRPFLAEAAARIRRKGWSNLRLIEGDLLAAELPPAFFELVWARWVLSFPPDPGAIVSRLAATLRPGGRLAVMDYYHEGIGLHPRSQAFAAAVRATRELYARAGGDPWIAARLPALNRSAGLELEEFTPVVLSGAPGEPAFEWASRFFPPWTEDFARQGLMSQAEVSALRSDWAARQADPDARFFSPIVAVVVGRKPA